MFNFVSTGVTALRFVLSLGTGIFKHAKADSLISFSKATRVEPIAIVDRRAAALPYVGDVMQTLNSLFIGYYLQAVSLLVNVGNINVLKLLDSINPDRDVASAAHNYLVDKINPEKMGTKVSFLSLESYGQSLPIPNENASMEDHDRMIAAAKRQQKIEEGFGKVSKAFDEVTGIADMDRLAAKAKDDVGKNNIKINTEKAMEATNLSVGRLVDVAIEKDGQKASFPIQIRLIATIMTSNILTHILGDGSRDTSMRERWHGWKSGQLEFWRDLVLCQDLIDERRKALAKDDSGTYAEILARRAGNAAAGVLTETPSIATASNLIVLTTQTAQELETAIGGRLRDKVIRNKVFEQTYIMIMAVIDPEHEIVTFYHRNIALPTVLSVRELKVANKGAGPDVAEILKAYQAGLNPSI